MPGGTIDFLGNRVPDQDIVPALRGLMASGDVENPKVEKATSLRAVIGTMIREELKKEGLVLGKQRKMLSWGSNPPALTSDKIVGLWNQSLPYIGPIAGFVIQNCMLLRINGTEAILDEVSDKTNSWVTKNGEVKEAPSFRQTLTEALERHRAQAIRADPMLCRHCAAKGISKRAENDDDRTRHLYYSHPAEFADMVGLQNQTQVELPPSLEPPPAKPVEKTEAGFVCCGKEFKDLRALGLHRRVNKNCPENPTKPDKAA